MELFDDLITEEMVTRVLAVLSTAALVLGLLVKAARWAFRDRTTNEQRQLFDALLRRLENGALNWRSLDNGYLSLYEEGDLLVQGHSASGHCIYLGEVDVEPMLTRLQRNLLHVAAQRRRAQLAEERRYDTITAAIREARRPLGPAGCGAG